MDKMLEVMEMRVHQLDWPLQKSLFSASKEISGFFYFYFLSKTTLQLEEGNINHHGLGVVRHIVYITAFNMALQIRLTYSFC